MIDAQQLEALDPQVREAMLTLMSQVPAPDEQLRARDALIEQRERQAAFKQVLIDKLTHEVDLTPSHGQVLACFSSLHRRRVIHGSGRRLRRTERRGG
jgi:hypothetical protein